MKLWLTYCAVFLSGILALGVLFNASANPEQVILGRWQETAWAYEQGIAFAADIAAASKSGSVQPEFSFHKAEDWEFLPGGRLRLRIAGKEEWLSWSMKGRGHVLQIKYGDHRIENYQLTVLKNNKMVLNAESDLQARGIAQLIFERDKSTTYAQKIQ